MAVIVSTGDVAPVPPAAGGAVAGPLRIGSTDLGTMTINGGTALTNTGAAILGDSATGQGIVSLSGFASDWTLVSAGGDLTVGNNGSASLSISAQASLNANDDLFAATQLGSSAEVAISGFGSLLNVPDDMNFGQRGHAVMTISSGGRLLTDGAILGDEAAGEGRMTMTGPSSLWRATNTVTLGDAGRASMRVLAGARVENTSGTVANQAGSTAEVEVAGAGSNWSNSLSLLIGESGNGSLMISDGGRVSNGGGANLATVGRQIGSRGYVEVRDPGSLLTVSILAVGDSGNGSLHILNGGRVTSSLSVIGDTASGRGEVVVDGNGSALEMSAGIDIGDLGTGRLTISNGGLVETAGLVRVNARGQVTLDGGRLRSIATAPDNITVSGLVQGTGVVEGTVNNQSSGRIETRTGERLQFTGTVANSGVINLLGGEIEFDSAVTNSASTGSISARNALLRFDGGLINNGTVGISFGTTDLFGDITNNPGAQIIVSGGAQATFYDDTVNNGIINVSASGTVRSTAVFFGAVSGTGTFPGAGTVFFEGDLRPGNSPGTLSFGGDVELSHASVLRIELTDSAHDELDIAGRLGAAGTLDVVLLNGFSPGLGNEFDILDFARVSGQFGTLNLPQLDVPLAWDASRLHVDGTLAVVPEPAGLCALGTAMCLVGQWRRGRREVTW